MREFDFLDDLLQSFQRCRCKKCGRVDLAAPDRVQQHLAASCILEVILEQHLASLHIWINIPPAFAEALKTVHIRENVSTDRGIDLYIFDRRNSMFFPYRKP